MRALDEDGVRGNQKDPAEDTLSRRGGDARAGVDAAVLSAEGVDTLAIVYFLDSPV